MFIINRLLNIDCFNIYVIIFNYLTDNNKLQKKVMITDFFNPKLNI